MKNKTFYKTFMLLALPLAMQNLITTSVSLVDNVMIGQLGDTAIAAVGLANKLYFIYSLIIYGLCGGASAFITQFYGKKDLKGVKHIVFLNTLIALLFAIIFFIATFAFPHKIMQMLTNDTTVKELGRRYLKITSSCYIFVGLSSCFSYSLKSMEHPKIPLLGSAFSIIINTFLNYILIFGNLGAVKLGTDGAAIATLIARIFEFLFVVSLAFIKFDFLRQKLYEYREIQKEFIIKFLKNVFPVTLNETFWALGTTVISAIYARVSTEAVAAANIVSIMFDLSSIFLYGAGQATGIVVGKEIGKKNYSYAYYITDKLSLFVPLICIPFALIMYFICPYFVNLFKVSMYSKEVVRELYIIMAVLTPFRALSHINIVGSLRNGGDTLFCLLCDVGCIWLFGIPGAYITGMVLKLPIFFVYLASQSAEFMKAIFIFLRLRKKSWIKDLVNK